MNRAIALLLLIIPAVILPCACTPHVTRTDSGLEVNSGIWGPRVSIGGIRDDGDPVTVNVRDRSGRSVVSVEEDD